MLSPRICKQCKLGKVSEPLYDEKGFSVRRWGVDCFPPDDSSDDPQMLLLTDEAPEWCPYEMEHKLETDSMPQEFFEDYYNSERDNPERWLEMQFEESKDLRRMRQQHDETEREENG